MLDPIVRQFNNEHGAAGFSFMLCGELLNPSKNALQQELDRGDIVDAFPRSQPDVLADSFEGASNEVRGSN